MQTVLLISAAAVAAFLLLGGRQLFDAVGVEITGFGIPRIGDGAITLPLQIQVSNPVPVDFTIQDFEVRLSQHTPSGVVEIGASEPKSIALKGGGATIVSLEPVIRTTSQVTSNLAEQLGRRIFGQKLTFTALIRGRVAGIRFSESEIITL